MALADFQQLVKRMVPEDGETLTESDRDAAIDLAVLRYGTDAPRTLVRDTAWLLAGFLGPLPPDWVDGSALRSAEYPIGRNPASLVEMALYADQGGTLLVVQDMELPAGAQVRVTFGAPHRLDETEDTIPLQHREAVASYAAHSLCRQLSVRYSGEREASINADGSNTESRARNYAARAKEFRSAYFVGIGQVDPYAAGARTASSGVTAASSTSTWPGRMRYGLTRWGRP